MFFVKVVNVVIGKTAEVFVVANADVADFVIGSVKPMFDTLANVRK